MHDSSCKRSSNTRVVSSSCFTRFARSVRANLLRWFLASPSCCFPQRSGNITVSAGTVIFPCCAFGKWYPSERGLTESERGLTEVRKRTRVRKLQVRARERGGGKEDTGHHVTSSQNDDSFRVSEIQDRDDTWHEYMTSIWRSDQSNARYHGIVARHAKHGLKAG